MEADWTGDQILRPPFIQRRKMMNHLQNKKLGEYIARQEGNEQQWMSWVFHSLYSYTCRCRLHACDCPVELHDSWKCFVPRPRYPVAVRTRFWCFQSSQVKRNLVMVCLAFQATFHAAQMPLPTFPSGTSWVKTRPFPDNKVTTGSNFWASLIVAQVLA
jgi:hypothetical protein